MLGQRHATQPYTFGWQPNYTIEGKILGQYIKQHFAGQKVGVLYQDDDFGQGGLAGIQDEVPAAQIVSKQAYQSGDDRRWRRRSPRSRRPRPRCWSTSPSRSTPRSGSSPRSRSATSRSSSSPTSGSTRPPSAACSRRSRKGKASGTALIEGAITDGYLPSTADTSNPWIQLFKKIHDQYDASAPFDGNVEYGMANAYTLVQALKAAGKNLTRQDVVDAINNNGGEWTGPGLVPFRYTQDRPRRLRRRRDGPGPPRQDRPLRRTADDAARPSTPITPYTTPQPAPPATGMPSS